MWFEPAPIFETAQGLGRAPEWLAAEPDDAGGPETPSGESRVSSHGQVAGKEATPRPEKRTRASDTPTGATEKHLDGPEGMPPESGQARSAASETERDSEKDNPTGGELATTADRLDPAPRPVDLSPGEVGPDPQAGTLPSLSGQAGPAGEVAGMEPGELGSSVEAQAAPPFSVEAGPAGEPGGVEPGVAGSGPEPRPLPSREPSRPGEPGSLQSREAGAAGLGQGEAGAGSVPGAAGVESVPEDDRSVPPGLEPGLHEILRRLVAPPGQGREQSGARPAGEPLPNWPTGPAGDGAPDDDKRVSADGGASVDGGAPGDGDAPAQEQRDAQAEKVAAEALLAEKAVAEEMVVDTSAEPQSEDGDAQTGTSVTRQQKENISPARSASKRGRRRKSKQSSPGEKRRPNVSRETLSSGEVADTVGEDEVIEDEAAIAVREAASRAAAEVPGANDSGQRGPSSDSQDDVSRETSQGRAETPEGSDGSRPETAVAGKAAASREEPPRTVDMERAARDARVTFRIAHGAYNRFAIAVANQKGGVGKSTTAVNLGAYLALAGARVLVVDLDPQGNASTGLGLDHREVEPSVYDVLTGESDAASAIRQTPVTNLDVLPSTIDLAGAEVELVNAFSRETRLRQALGAVRYGYDLVFIDCPPSLGLLTVNALAAADELLIPIQCEYYALEGLGQLLRNVDLVRVNLNQALHIGGIVLTMYDGRTRLAEQVVQEVRKHFTDLVYQTVVPRSVRLSESPGYGVPIALYDPLSRGGIAYRDLALELADRTGLLAPTREGAK